MLSYVYFIAVVKAISVHRPFYKNSNKAAQNYRGKNIGREMDKEIHTAESNQYCQNNGGTAQIFIVEEQGYRCGKTVKGMPRREGVAGRIFDKQWYGGIYPAGTTACKKIFKDNIAY